MVFNPRVPLDLSEETCGKIMKLLAKVEQCGHYYVVFLAYPEECHEGEADRLVADAQTAVGVVESPLSIKNGRK